jgi:Tfp pilus assembly protein PilF
MKAMEEFALAIDPSLGKAHAAMAGWVLWEQDWNWEGAEKEFKRALELDPSDADTHCLYGVFLGSLGRSEEALREMELARKLDPLSAYDVASIGYIYLRWLRQPDRAINIAPRASRLRNISKQNSTASLACATIVNGDRVSAASSSAVAHLNFGTMRDSRSR